jgi:hypothetical protein
LSLNLEVSTFWDPQGLSRPVMGLLYFFCFNNGSFIVEETNTNRQIHNNKPDIIFRDNERGNVYVDRVAILRDINVVKKEARENYKIRRILLQKYSACGMEK